MPKSVLRAVLGRMQFTLHATRRTPHGASRFVQAKSAWLVKTRRAPSRHSRDARVYGHTTAMHKLRTPPPRFPLKRQHTPKKNGGSRFHFPSKCVELRVEPRAKTPCQNRVPNRTPNRVSKSHAKNTCQIRVPQPHARTECQNCMPTPRVKSACRDRLLKMWVKTVRQNRVPNTAPKRFSVPPCCPSTRTALSSSASWAPPPP